MVARVVHSRGYSRSAITPLSPFLGANFFFLSLISYLHYAGLTTRDYRLYKLKSQALLTSMIYS